MKNVLLRQLVLAAVSASFAVATVGAETRALGGAQGGLDPNAAASGSTKALVTAPTPPQLNPPLIDWMAPQVLDLEKGIGGSLASSLGKTSTKATLTVSTFIPIAPCRLVDTRGVFSPVYAGGPFAANEIRIYSADGNCGIPAGANRIQAISIAITTPPTSLSGDIEAIAAGATLGTTVAMVIQAGQWNSVSITPRVNSNGDFQVQLRSTPGDVVIDINGYYASTSNTQTSDFLSVIGSYAFDGGIFYVENNSTVGAAINAVGTSSMVHLGQGNNAIDVNSGGFRVRNSGLNTSTMAFVHKVNTAGSYDSGTGTLCAGFPAYSVINHPSLNNTSTAIVLLQPVEYYNGNTGATGTAFGNYPVIAYYAGVGVCTSDGVGHWTVRRAGQLCRTVTAWATTFWSSAHSRRSPMG